ncbi:UNVERIFIED_ORG: hypothetical protein ABID57_000722 [Arthrobacter sp. UYEF1]
MSQQDLDELSQAIKDNRAYQITKLVFDILSRPVIALLNKLFSR